MELPAAASCVDGPQRLDSLRDGWTELDNGGGGSAFDVLITTDRNLRYQQNLSGRRLAILVLPTTSWPNIQSHEAQIAAAVDALHPGEVLELNFS